MLGAMTRIGIGPHDSTPRDRRRPVVAAMLCVVALAALALPAGGQEALTFDIHRDGDTYVAQSLTTPSSYVGTLKSVVESAVAELFAAGGGTVSFRAGEFDLGADSFELEAIADITFVGQGIDVTVLRNDSDASHDSEVFDSTRSDRLVVADMTVHAAGPPRTTSDALDFDGGNDVVVDRVKVTAARGRAIVFDGKGTDSAGGSTADRNIVRDCVITGTVTSHGIELLASNGNTIQGCTITDVGGNGIHINKASSVARQPNKPSNDNTIRGNHVVNAGRGGIMVNSGSRNVLEGNTVLNSADDVARQDGIRVTSFNGVACDDNVVSSNIATDDQDPRTQRYGLNIASALCNRTVVADNLLTGNLVGEIQDLGTDTRYPIPSSQLMIPAAADTDVREHHPTHNFGTLDTIHVDNRPQQQSLLSFEVTGIGEGSVQSARLRLHNTNSSPDGGTIYRVADTTWDEQTVTWDTAPVPDPTPLAVIGAVDRGTTYDIELGDAITHDGRISLMITSSSKNVAFYSSREGANPPVLIIDVTGGATRP